MSILSLHRGKVRDSAALDNGSRIIHTSSRVSAFDVILPFEIPQKSEVLQAISTFQFLNTRHLVRNHFIGSLDTTHVLVQNVEVIPLEIIVRGSLSGSLLRLYTERGPQGVKDVYGISIEKGLPADHIFRFPLLTPTTKAERGHDRPVTHTEAIRIIEGFVRDKKLSLSPTAVWERIEAVAKLLFAVGKDIAEEGGLELLDTKYEFGILNEELVLVDEIHTPDCSRYR